MHENTPHWTKPQPPHPGINSGVSMPSASDSVETVTNPGLNRLSGNSKP
ncbi:MAG: hypothetical protein WC568_12195 [Candidatus Methanoperedens sp.]